MYSYKTFGHSPVSIMLYTLLYLLLACICAICNLQKTFVCIPLAAMVIEDSLVWYSRECLIILWLVTLRIMGG